MIVYDNHWQRNVDYQIYLTFRKYLMNAQSYWARNRTIASIWSCFHFLNTFLFVYIGYNKHIDWNWSPDYISISRRVFRDSGSQKPFFKFKFSLQEICSCRSIENYSKYICLWYSKIQKDFDCHVRNSEAPGLVLSYRKTGINVIETIDTIYHFLKIILSEHWFRSDLNQFYIRGRLS